MPLFDAPAAREGWVESLYIRCACEVRVFTSAFSNSRDERAPSSAFSNLLTPVAGLTYGVLASDEEYYFCKQERDILFISDAVRVSNGSGLNRNLGLVVHSGMVVGSTLVMPPTSE